VHINASVIIATANRAADLRDTLENLARIHRPGTVELIIVDNCSTDDTRQVVDHAAACCPFPVRYLFEQEAGKYAALNAGIKVARGAVIAATDDDARFEPDWLERAVDGLRDHECEFVGGRVLPIWGGPKPLWLSERSGLHAKVIAILDHGPAVREFGRGISWPLGVNVAYRREAFDRVGLFDSRLGRKTGTLRNQAQREWHLRGRAFGARGFYLPDMVVHHLVAAARLEKRYFRRWLYWHGISRALLFKHGGFDMEEPEIEPPPHADERCIAGVPIHLLAKASRSAGALAWHALHGRVDTAFEYELWLRFFAGIVRQRWADRRQPVTAGPSTVQTHETASPPQAPPPFAGDRIDIATYALPPARDEIVGPKAQPLA
jgi:glycosyltransferase involved in cell wall biosynthesis